MNNISTSKPLKIINNMNGSNSGDVRSFLKQLKHFETREKKDASTALNELRRILTRASTLEELEVDWAELVHPLKWLLSQNSTPEHTLKAVAACLSSLGILALPYFELFLDLLAECWKEIPARKEERRTHLLQALIPALNSVYERECIFMQTTQEKLCSTAMSFLDSNNSVGVLSPAMEVILLVSAIVPKHLFLKKYFQDTVDVAIGWLVEEGQEGLTPAKLERTREILLEMSPFWSDKMDLLLNLAKQFLEDMRGHVEDAKRELEEEHVTRVKAIAGTLLLLIKICEKVNTPAAALVVKDVSDEVRALLRDHSILVYLSSERIAAIYALYIDILTHCTPFQSDETKMETLKELINLSDESSHSSQIRRGLLTFLSKLASEQRESLSVPMCSLIFAPSSFMATLDFSRLSPLELSSLSSLLKSLLNPSILNVLQYAYAAVVAMMKESLRRLVDTTNDPCEGVRINDEIRITIVVYALKDILILKNSLIVMLGLSPPLLDVVVLDSLILDPRLQSNHPTIHYTLLAAAFEHCKAHDNFTRTSDWLAGGTGSQSVLGESLSSHHLQRIVCLLATLLASNALVANEARILLIDWVLDLAPSLHLATKSPLAARFLSGLADSLRLAMCYAPQTTWRVRGLLTALEKEMKEESLVSMDVSLLRSAIERSHSEERSVALWNHLPTDALIESYSSYLPTPSISMPSICSSASFEQMMNFLLQRIPPTETTNAEKDDQKDEWLIPPSSISSDLPTYWRHRLMSAAAYAIEARMTTHLGKPGGTLNAIHVEMTRLFKQASLRKKEDRDDSSLLAHEEWFRVRCLLEFIEILERLIYLTHTGSMQSYFNPSPAARHWFKTNESVCTEWFSRMYPCAMGVAFHASAYSQVIRFGQSALLELEKKHSTKVEEPPRIVLVVLCWMIRALIEKGDGIMIRGLKDWSRDLFTSPSFKWDWMDSAAGAAIGIFEDAINGASEVMKREETPEDVKMLMQHVLMTSWTKQRRMGGESEESGVDADDLERCQQLTSFARVETMKEGSDAIWNLDSGLQTTEVWMMTTILKSELTKRRDLLAVEATTAMLMDDDGILTGRYSSLCSIAGDVYLRMEKQHQSIDDPYALICSVAAGSISPAESFSLCRQKNGWAGRLVHKGTTKNKAIYELAKLATKRCNWGVLDEMRKGLDGSDLRMNLSFGELMSRQLEITTPSGGEPARENYVKMGLLPLMAEAFHVYAGLEMEESMNGASSFGESSAEWATAIAKTALRMTREMGEEETLHTDGMSKLHFALESRRAETGLDEKGVLLHLSTTLDPRLAKARLALGIHILKLIEEDKNPETIINILLDTIQPTQCAQILEAIVTATSEEELKAKIKAELGLTITMVERVMDSPGMVTSLWQQFYLRRRILLSNAVVEFFAFLSYNGYESSIRCSTAALHLLSILTRHTCLHPGLAQQITDGITIADERVWAGILPQMLARIAHPIEGVRRGIMEAIRRLGRSFPHSTVFQLVVATRSREIVQEDLFEDDPETTRITKPTQAEIIHYGSCSALLEDLAGVYPRMVEDTRIFVDEMHHLNLIEEKWCYVLHHLDIDMGKRLNLMKKEGEKTRGSEEIEEEEKKRVINHKNELIVGPIYRIIADFWRSTVSRAERGSEDAARFVASNREHVERAMKESEEGRKNGDENARWEAFIRLNVTLGRRASKKGGQVVDVSHCIPKLIEMAGRLSVPLPGQLPIPEDEVIYLSRVDPICQVLCTKTRPKKMSMRGSDGVDRAYLLKTHEDLRLDERIMQILQMSNLMMKKIGKRDAPQYTAKTYAVTPLGPLIGLIQWVHGAVPLYTFYRKWQMRETAKVTGGKKAPDGVSLKPLELFEKKMKEMLSANKLDPKMYSDRKSWPPELMKALFDELCEETAKDLISREMWIRSQTPAHWLKMKRTFTRSTAVMSMIGSVLGLGDRHPDNLLINMHDFHVIHIDYNVCFDRGRKLRVPETVPFRLTQNIKHAFGVAGLEGLFTSSCTAVLSSLRRHQLVFSLLLHPFVFDSLMDWTIRDSIGSSVQQAVLHIVYGNDGRTETRGKTAATLFQIKMRESGRALEKLSTDAMEYVETMYCGGEGGKKNGEDPLSRWMEMMDDMIVIARRDEGRQNFLYEERREVARAKEAMAWNGMNEGGGGAGGGGEGAEKSPLQMLIHVIPKMMEQLNAMREECEKKKEGDDVGLPPGLEALSYKDEEENQVGMAIVTRVMKKVKGELGGQDGVITNEKDQATSLIRAAGSRLNNSLMYEGWIGWV